LDSEGFLKDRGEICQTCSALAVVDEDFCTKCRKTPRKKSQLRKRRKNAKAAEAGNRENERAHRQALGQAARAGGGANEEEKEEAGGEEEAAGDDDEDFDEAAFFLYLFELGEKEEDVRNQKLGAGLVNWRALYLAVKDGGVLAASMSLASWKQAYARYCVRLKRSPKGGVRLPKKMEKLYNKWVDEYAGSLAQALADAEGELDEGSGEGGGAMDDTESDVDILDTDDFNQVRACRNQKCPQSVSNSLTLSMIYLREI
jgi:hypothetical protein